MEGFLGYKLFGKKSDQANPTPAGSSCTTHKLWNLPVCLEEKKDSSLGNTF